LPVSGIEAETPEPRILLTAANNGRDGGLAEAGMARCRVRSFVACSTCSAVVARMTCGDAAVAV
jgi:hypothetical protein